MPEKLTHSELLNRLEEQIELLQLNAELFDRGHTVTTLTIATVIRVLFHDTDKSTSLIKQICDSEGKNKDDFKMITTKSQDFGEAKLVLFGDGLCNISFKDQSIFYFPRLANAEHTTIPFRNWWEERVIKNVSSGFENPEWMTRAELIKLHANKEGGTHVDEKKNKKISAIGTQEAAGWIGFTRDVLGVCTELPMTMDQKQATIRQICYEVLISLYNHFPELFKQEIH